MTSRDLAMSGPSADTVAPWVEGMARVGYAAKAVLYMTIGLLAAQAGLGSGGRTTDTHGALRVVHGVTLGRVILLIIAAGLVGYALWRLVEAVVDPERRGTGPKAVAVRIGFAARGLFHGALGVTALRLALGEGDAASGNEAKRWTARAFDAPGGELLVWLAAVGIAVYGLYQLYRAYVPKLGRHLELGSLEPRVRRWIVRVSRFGLAARGVVFCLVGFILARAAARHDPGQAGGLRESLRTLAGIGHWPFVLVAIGLVAYGVYELVNAHYRRIRVT
jgi:hypothetical protein